MIVRTTSSTGPVWFATRPWFGYADVNTVVNYFACDIWTTIARQSLTGPMPIPAKIFLTRRRWTVGGVASVKFVRKIFANVWKPKSDVGLRNAKSAKGPPTENPWAETRLGVRIAPGALGLVSS